MPTPANGSDTSSEPTETSALSGMIGAALRRIHVPRLMAATGSVDAMSIGRISLGNATIDRVIVQNLSASVDTGRVLLQDVRSILDLRIGISYRLRAGPFRAGGEPSVGMSFPFDIGTVDVPQLEDIELSIPNATVDDAAVSILPIHNLDLGSAQFSDLQLDEADLPSAGFSLLGLTLGPVRLNDITVPAVTTAQVHIGEFAPSGLLTLPAAEIRQIALPEVRAPRVSSIAAVDVENARASRQSQRLVNLGFLRISVFAEPTLHIHIGALTLDDLTASSVIERIRLEDISAPVTISDIALGDLTLEQITVNQVTV